MHRSPKVIVTASVIVIGIARRVLSGAMASRQQVAAELKHALSAFQHRDFTIFWSGALISNIGSWLQNLTVPFVIYALTGSAFWVGAATAAQFLPGFILSPYGGHLADIRERRIVIIIVQSLMGLVALLLWWSWIAGIRSVALLLVITAATGLLQGINLPSWQAFVNDLVPREELISAVSLNSLQFNAARSIGPALAGLIIAVFGPGWAFGLNVASYVVVVLALVEVRSRSHAITADQRPTRFVDGFVEAVRYVPSQPGIALVIWTVAAIGLLATPVFSFTVVFAHDVYGVGPLQLGLLSAAFGVGAVLAVPFVVRAKHNSGLAAIMRAGLFVEGVAIVAFGLAPGVVTGALCLVGVGFGFLLAISAGNTALHLIVAQRLRGRVMALRLMTYMVSATVGALIEGWLVDLYGPRAAMVGIGLVFLAAVSFLLTPRGGRALARIDDPEDLVARA